MSGVFAPVLALDPGDGSSVVSRQIRRPEQLDAGKPEPVLVDRLRGPALRADKDALSVYQVYAMFFGTLVDNDGYVVLGTGDSILQDPNHLVYGGVPQSAQIRLDGDPFVTVAVEITGGTTTGFTLGSFETDYGTPPLAGLNLGAAGVVTLSVGARLQLDAGSLSAGAGQQIGYTVSAVYE